MFTSIYIRDTTAEAEGCFYANLQDSEEHKAETSGPIPEF